MDEKDDFERAFDASNDDKPLDAPAPAPQAAPAPAPAETPAPAPAETDGSAAEAQPAAPAQAPAVDTQALEHRFKSLQGIAARQGDEIKAYRRKMEELEQRLSAAPTPPSPAPAPQEPDPEDQLIAELEESAPTVGKAVKVLFKKQRQEFDREIGARFEQERKAFRGELTPLKQSAEEAEILAHEATISKAHPGWEDLVVSQEMMQWVQSKPSFVQREFNRIAATGTAVEVIEVLDEFMRDKPQKSAPDPLVSQTNALQQQRLRAATAVDTRPRPTSLRGAPAEKSFDQAFDEASQTA
jgi:hypothetical protein